MDNTKAGKGIDIRDLTWIEAQKVLNHDTVVCIALGAQAKEHGPHLKLKNDWLIAVYLKKRVLSDAYVVLYPTISYHYYPAFREYPGSVTLELDTATKVIEDICNSIAVHGPRRFYIINTGVSTLKPLKKAKESLAQKGILLCYTDLLKILKPIEKEILEQEGGTHADEGETSMMLYIAKDTVDMTKAVKDYNEGEGPLTRVKGGNKGTYSPSGVYGDPTLATPEKGEIIVEHLVKGVLLDIENCRTQHSARR